MAKKKNVMVIDTETAMLDTSKGVYGTNMLTYDIGAVITDKKGNISAKCSFIVQDIFFNDEIMSRAYFSSKVPQYLEDAKNGKRVIASWIDIRNYLTALMEQYEVSEVWAYNAQFDIGTLNRTNKTLCGEWEYFPHGTVIKCILRLAECSIVKQKLYRQFCEKNGYLTCRGCVRKTAEYVYQYISFNHDFIEEHTALEDAIIESEILAKCFRQHKKLKPSILVHTVA